MFDKDNIIRIDFIRKIAGIELEYVALYNKTNTTDEEADEAIELYGLGENPKVIIMSKKQFDNVFISNEK